MVDPSLHVKVELAEKGRLFIQTAGQAIRQVSKGAGVEETHRVAKGFVSQEGTIASTHNRLRQLQTAMTDIDEQLDLLSTGFSDLPEICASLRDSLAETRQQRKDPKDTQISEG